MPTENKPAAPPPGEPVVYAQFLTDVMTAAGLVAHGKQDKKFAERLADECARLQAERLTFPGRLAPASGQHQGEPVAYMAKRKNPTGNARLDRPLLSLVGEDGWGPAFECVPLYAEQPAPVAVVMPERSSQDYAIEHAEYTAQAADDVLAKFQAYGLTLLAVDEGGEDGEGELFEAIDTARGDLQESLVDLRSMVYEFRKRSNRCPYL